MISTSSCSKIELTTFISGSTLLGVEGVDAGDAAKEPTKSGSTPFLSL